MKINNQKNISIRTCLITNKQCFKNQLIRLVKSDNHLVIDYHQTLKQRGFYILKDKFIIKQPNFISLLEKRTRTKISNQLLNELNLMVGK